MISGKRLISILSFFLIFSISELIACTTAIVSGKFTVDGRPLLLKHRDSSFEQNKLVYFEDGKYNYIGLVNSVDKEGKEVWGGCNSAGFAIINSASYNMKPDEDTTELVDQEGVIMKNALQVCQSVDEFEQLLKELKKPLGVEANFGVIDAKGNCAYFECNNFEYKKIDVNDLSVAPFGYVIRTNFSANGSKDEGYGYIRYSTAENLFFQASSQNNLSYEFILQKVSRSLKHSLTEEDLNESSINNPGRKFVPFEDYIPRNSSVATILIQGVKPGESAKLSTIWTILGFQLCSIAVPVWVESGENLPEYLVADKTGNAPLCDLALKLKDKCFPIKRGSGSKYLNLPAVINKEQTGILQQIFPIENEIISEYKVIMKNWREKKHIPKQEAQNFYQFIDKKLAQFEKSISENILVD